MSGEKERLRSVWVVTDRLQERHLVAVFASEDKAKRFEAKYKNGDAGHMRRDSTEVEEWVIQ